MRERSNTIFAANLEEYISEMERSEKVEDERNSSDNVNKRQRLKSKLSEVIEESAEMEKETESGNNEDSDLDLLGMKVEYKLQFKSNHESECQSTLSTKVASSSNDSILNQNLVLSNQRIKLMIIGDRAVGKTSLANILTRSITNRQKYEPTQSLDIKKCIYYSKNTTNTINIELWDTNSLILTSKLIQTYFKICDGFILICNLSNTDSIRFLEKMIENIINFSPIQNFNNIQIYANMNEDLNLDEYQFNLAILSDLVETFQLESKVIYANLHEYSIDKDEIMDKFFSNCRSAKMSKGNRRLLSKGDNSEYVHKLSSTNVNNCTQIQMQALSEPSPQTFIGKKQTARKDKEMKCSIY